MIVSFAFIIHTDTVHILYIGIERYWKLYLKWNTWIVDMVVMVVIHPLDGMLPFAVVLFVQKMWIKCCENFKLSISIDFYCASTLKHAPFKVFSVCMSMSMLQWGYSILPPVTEAALLWGMMSMESISRVYFKV